MEFPDARILVFAKAPVPGRAKTRLISVLGEQGAAEMHSKLVCHTLETATQAGLCSVELWSADEHDHPFFNACADRYPVALKQQRGTGLGQRMSLAMSEALKESSHVLLVGTDCPSLTKNDLREALQALHNGQDCMLNPAADGGYVLIGLGRFNTLVFSDIPWGTEKVLGETRKRLEMLGWQWRELKTHYDIDRPEDLERDCLIASLRV